MGPRKPWTIKFPQRLAMRHVLLGHFGAGLAAMTPLQFMLSVRTNDDLPLACGADAAQAGAFRDSTKPRTGESMGRRKNLAKILNKNNQLD